MPDSQFICPNCQSITAPDDAFCSRCGFQLNRPVKIGIGKQVWIYFVSVFLPPLGLIWTWKYLRGNNPQAKRIGWVALILTIIATVVTVWVTIGFFQGIQNQINSVSNFSNYQGY